MTHFEETSCKVLGVILFLLIMSMILQIAMGCNPPRPEMEGEPIPEYILKTIEIFEDYSEEIDSTKNDFSNLLTTIPSFSVNSKMRELVEKMNWALIKSRNVI